MSNLVTVVGIGPGHEDYMIPKALKIINESDRVIGFERALMSVNVSDEKLMRVESLKEILEMAENYEGNLAIVASGDPLFYGISDYLKRNMKRELKVIPGISSFQYLASKMVIPWNNALVSSMHGRENSFLEEILNKEVSFWLTGKKNTPQMLCGLLSKGEVQCTVIVGENLSYEDEKITEGTPTELAGMEFSSLSVMIVKRRSDG